MAWYLLCIMRCPEAQLQGHAAADALIHDALVGKRGGIDYRSGNPRVSPRSSVYDDTVMNTMRWDRSTGR